MCRHELGLVNGFCVTCHSYLPRMQQKGYDCVLKKIISKDHFTVRRIVENVVRDFILLDEQVDFKKERFVKRLTDDVSIK